MYSKQCQYGRDAAMIAIRDANIPTLVKLMREAAKDETGFGAGVLFAIAGYIDSRNQ